MEPTSPPRHLAALRSPRRAGRAAAIVLVFAATAAGVANGAEPPALELSADGREVINTEAGIAWARCVEGTQWSGRACVGSPRLLDHAQALAAAGARRQADGKSWRLPRVPELRRLVAQAARPEHLAFHPFPDAPEAWHWTSTTTLDTSRVNPYDYANIRQGLTNDTVVRVSFLHGWAVHTASGDTDGQVVKRTRLPVRLVRSLQP